MACREFLQKLDSALKLDAEIEHTNVEMTPFYDNGKMCEANIVASVENKFKIYKVTVEEIGVYDGLKIS